MQLPWSALLRIWSIPKLMVSACVWWRCAPILSIVWRGARAPASLQDPPRHPSYHTATKTRFSPNLSLSNSIDCMCEKDWTAVDCIFTASFTLIAIACRMEPREHQSKCQRGWVKLSLQFWAERPNWLKKPRRVCSMKRTGIPFSAGQLKEMIY